VVHAGVWGIAGLSLGIPAIRSARAQSAGGVGSVRLADDLHVQTVGGINVVALTGADGVALVDGGPAEHADALLESVARLPGGGAVHTLFNTHWHREQTGSNERLGHAKAAIIAQENTRLWLSTDITWPWDDSHTFEPLPAVARPNKTTFDKDRIRVGAKTVEYGYLRHAAHTDGDLYVFFPDANVLAVGDAVTSAGWQVIDWWTGGWIGGVVGGLELLLSLTDAKTRIVPARGRVMTKADLMAQFDMYSTVYERLSRLLNSGRGPREAVESKATVEYDEKMGRSDEFVTRAFESMWAYLSPDA
jgi:glyoxylase-like metal-dependent hydrolase (beta-lactamase superfamily II)